MNNLFEGLLAGSALLTGAALGVIAWRREEGIERKMAGLLAVNLLILGWLQILRAFGLYPTPTRSLGLGALASGVLSVLFVRLVPRYLATPGPDQVRALSEAKVQELAEDLEAKVREHSVQLQEHETRLQGQKLESLGILAGGLAHDFNNLLGAMAGTVELAKLETGRGGPVQPHLEALEALVNRSSSLVQQILAYSGKGKAQILALDLNHQVQEMTRLMRASLSRKAALRVETAPDLPAMMGDVPQIQQVIMNLVLNASEAVDTESGVITIATGVEELDAEAIERSFKGQGLVPGTFVYLEVIDNGPGMPPAVQARIFDPFFTTKFTGRGLGLSAIQGIVRSHRGGIRVSSEPWKGTSFKLVFPASSEAPAVLAEAPPFLESLEEYRGTGTILVVDDEDPLRTVAVRALQIVGFSTLEARDGLEALQVFEGNQPRIRLILMDLTMPRMDGEEAYRALRRSGVLVPVILSSGFTEHDVIQHFRGRGIAGFLQKPYRLQVLLAMVRKALEGQAGLWPGVEKRDQLRWSADDQTGNAILDHQHEALVDDFNDLVTAVRAGAVPLDQEHCFLHFKDTALTHFGVEDGIMQRFQYPRRREHQAAHASLIAQVNDLAERIHNGTLGFTAPVLDFLEGWLIHHMQDEDGRLARFLRDKGH
jgi:hemerythrin-like metal-binding protein